MNASTKTTKVPRVASRRVQTTLHAALNRAKDDQDKEKEQHIKAMLNGATPLPVPNLKKVKK